MEDRHTLSEPRLVSSTAAPELLCWEVDIYRANVSEPVDTVLINNATLPPRKRKHKVVWRLPTEPDKVPNFGTDEKRRILELFKDQKKNRRKELKQSVKKEDGATKEEEEEDRKKQEEEEEAEEKRKQEEKKKRKQKEEKMRRDEIESRRREVEELMKKVKLGREQDRKTAQEKLNRRQSKKQHQHQEQKEQENKQQQNQDQKKAKEKEKKEEKEPQNQDQKNYLEPGRHLSQPSNQHQLQDQHLQPTNQQQLQPTNNNLMQQEEKKHPSPKNLPQQPTHQPTPQPQSSIQYQPTTSLPNAPPPGILPPQPHTQSLHILIPSSPTPSVLAAKQFIHIYYSALTSGQTLTLSSYYTPHAQKSVSVGGAHSVVTGRDAIQYQMSNLSHSLFKVVGVVAQDGSKGDVHILVTGLCNTQGVESAFAHSVGLVRTCENGFQIQNDALALLSQDIISTTTTTAVDQHQQQQQQQGVGSEEETAAHGSGCEETHFTNENIMNDESQLPTPQQVHWKEKQESGSNVIQQTKLKSGGGPPFPPPGLFG